MALPLVSRLGYSILRIREAVNYRKPDTCGPAGFKANLFEGVSKKVSATGRDGANCSTGVSECYFPRVLGEEEIIDRNSPMITNPATKPEITICETLLPTTINCNSRARLIRRRAFTRNRSYQSGSRYTLIGVRRLVRDAKNAEFSPGMLPRNARRLSTLNIYARLWLWLEPSVGLLRPMSLANTMLISGLRFAFFVLSEVRRGG